MLSGVVGFWGSRLVYRLLAFTLVPEFGRARLKEIELPKLLRRATRLVERHWEFTEYDFSDWGQFGGVVLGNAALRDIVWGKLKVEREDARKALLAASRVPSRGLGK